MSGADFSFGMREGALDAVAAVTADDSNQHRHFPYARRLLLGWHKGQNGTWVSAEEDERNWEVLCRECGDTDGPAEEQSKAVQRLRGPTPVSTRPSTPPRSTSTSTDAGRGSLASDGGGPTSETGAQSGRRPDGRANRRERRPPICTMTGMVHVLRCRLIAAKMRPGLAAPWRPSQTGELPCTRSPSHTMVSRSHAGAAPTCAVA